MTTITRTTSKGQLVKWTFAQDAVAASQTNAQLSAMEDQSLVKGYEAPFDGEIIAVGFTLDSAGSAGSFTIGPTIDGTEDTDGQITVGTDAANYVRVQRGDITFNAGQSIGAEITTDGSWDGTTSDLVVEVYALLYIEEV